MHSEHEAQSEEGGRVQRLLLKTGARWACSPALLPLVVSTVPGASCTELLGSLLTHLDQLFWSNPWWC